MTLENGRGYQGAEVIRENEQEVGVIPVDALFSPVQRVRYKIEDTRVGQRTNYDRLTIEIWTNGTVTPEMALVESSKILRKHLTPFVGYSEPGPEVAALEEMEDEALVDTELEEKLRMSLAELYLSVRATICHVQHLLPSVQSLIIPTSLDGACCADRASSLPAPRQSHWPVIPHTRTAPRVHSGRH